MFVVPAAAAGCSDGTGGATCTGGATGASEPVASWAEWPMPNSQVDVTAGAPNLQSYTDDGDGTVTDNVTGLMWQQTVPLIDIFPFGYTWADAAAYCPRLTLAGNSDWRLPSAIELVSIVDVGQFNPSIDGTYFPYTYGHVFWSSSPLAGSSSNAWVVNFNGGGTGHWFGLSDAFDVRCVRSAWVETSAPAGRYVTASGTVYDTKTKLTWQQTVSSTTNTWADSKAYCAGVGASLGGTGWRLPTLKEVQTIVDYSRANPSIDPTAFPATQDVAYWSSSPAGSPSSAWIVWSDRGDTNISDVSLTFNVRCVR
jgi:hypothetical protein